MPTFDAGIRVRGLSVPVIVLAIACVFGMSVVLARAAADHLRESATSSALRNVEAIVRGYVDPALREDDLALGARPDPALADQLYRLTASGDIRSVHVWSRDGRTVYSTEPAVVGRRYSIDQDLGTAFAGTSVARYGDVGLVPVEAPPVAALTIYVPIRGSTDGAPFGVYQVLLDATDIEDRVAQTEQDVFVITLVTASALLFLLVLAFARTSRALARQNAVLRHQAATEELLTADIRRSEERFRSLVRNAADVILVLRENGTIAYESPAVSTVLGYDPADRVGASVFEHVHPDDQHRAARLLDEVARVPGAEVEFDVRARHADGSWRYLEGTGKNLLEDPAVGGIVVNYRDATSRRALEDQLRHQAFHDVLTGLANRALLRERLEHALASAERHERDLAVVFVDLDDFKAINDSFGHGAGDAVLAAVAERITAGLRPGDTAARVGGDEFCVLLEHLERRDEARDAAELILSSIRRPFTVGDREIRVHASLGVALRSTGSRTADDLLRDADVAMYVAKRRGKDRLEVFEPAVHLSTVVRLALLADLPKALEAGQFDLEYQPIVDLDTGALTGVEALLRWRHPQRGTIRPEDFVSLAEESGLIVEIGGWVLRQACRHVRVWDRVVAGPPLLVSVNVSGRQVHPSLVENVRDALRDARLGPERLLLEITESALLDDAEAARDVLQALRASGVRLAIDDFGTGYSSLDYLRRLPIDVLKIDRSFVASASADPGRAGLLPSIVRLGRSLGLEMIAEGVETAAQVDLLRSLGVRSGQGFHYSAPIPRSSMTAYLRGVRGARGRTERVAQTRAADLAPSEGTRAPS